MNKVKPIFQKATKVFSIEDITTTNGSTIDLTNEIVTATIADKNGNVIVEKPNNDPSIAKNNGKVSLLLTSEDTNLVVGNYTVEIKIDLNSGIAMIAQVSIAILKSNTGTKDVANTARMESL